MMGENQFDSPETRDANILSYEKTNKSLKISDNIFYGASYYCGYAFASVKNNRAYIYKGQYLNTYHGKKITRQSMQMIQATLKRIGN